MKDDIEITVQAAASSNRTEVRAIFRFYAMTSISDEVFFRDANSVVDIISRATEETKRELIAGLYRWISEYANSHGIALR